MKKISVFLAAILLSVASYGQFVKGVPVYGNQNVYGGTWVNKLFYLNGLKDTSKLGRVMFAVINPSDGRVDTLSLKSIS